jgi:hypothetical protein
VTNRLNQSAGRRANARGRRRRLGATKAAPDAIAGLVHADPAKARVMIYVGQLVADGQAEWNMLDNGDIQLSLNTGETLLLAERVIIRLA